MDTKRIAPVLLSQSRIDNHTVQAHYKAGYGSVVVKSVFSDDRPLADLFYEIIRKNHGETYRFQHD